MKLPDVAPERQEPQRMRAPLSDEQREQLRKLAASIEAIKVRHRGEAK